MVADFSILKPLLFGLGCVLLGLLSWLVVEAILVVKSARKIMTRVDVLTDVNSWVIFLKKTFRFFNK
jgi:hypothetical protein